MLKEAEGTLLGLKPSSPQTDLSLVRERIGI
jgi:hypothetical protein